MPTESHTPPQPDPRLDLARKDAREPSGQRAGMRETSTQGARTQGARTQRARIQEPRTQRARIHEPRMQRARIQVPHTQRARTEGSRTKGPRTRGLLALTATVIIWSSTFVLIKAVVEETGPFTLTFLRFLVALAALAPLARRHGFRWRMVTQREFLRFGLTGTALYYGLQNLGLMYTSAASAAMIQAGIPAVTALLSWRLLKERLPIVRVAGIALSVAGVLLIAGFQPAQAAAQSLVGNALILGSVVSFAAWTVQGKKLAASVHPAVMSAGSIAAGLLYLLPVTVLEIAVTGPPRISALGWFAVLYLGLLSSALTIFLWNFALTVVDATLAAVYINLVPVLGLLFAALSGETVAVVQLAGGGLALLGVWLSEVAGVPPAAAWPSAAAGESGKSAPKDSRAASAPHH